MTVLRAEDADFYEKYADELVRFATTLVGPSGAEDLLLATILSVFSSPAWRSVTNPRAYVYRALVNHASKQRRATQRRLAREIKAAPRTELAPPDPGLDDIDVRLALRHLSVRERAVIHLRFWNDLPVNDIAKALNVPVRTVERDLERARTRLQEYLT